MIARRIARMLWLSLVIGCGSNVHAQSASEYSIKAGYLLLFTRYVEWPAASFESASAPITICILGADPFGGVLDRTLEGQRSQDRPLRVLRIADSSAVRGCHIAFISKNESARQRRWLADLANSTVLTVAEDIDAFTHNTVLCFVSQVDSGRERIRFDASIPAMQRAGLKISSQMLVAARRVHRDSGS